MFLRSFQTSKQARNSRHPLTHAGAAMSSTLVLLSVTRWFGRIITASLLIVIVLIAITKIARADDEDPRKPSLYVPSWQSPATPPPPPVAWTISGTKAYVWAEHIPFKNCGDTDMTTVRYNFVLHEVTVSCHEESFTLPPLPEGIEVFEVRRSTMVMK